MTKARGESTSWRETITTGRNFAAKPRSAIQTSPGRGLIKEIQDFLLHLARPGNVEKSLVGQLNDFGHVAANLFRRFRTPLFELLVEPLSKDIHE